MSHDALSTGTGSQPINPFTYEGSQNETPSTAPPSKAVEVSKTALSELQNSEPPAKLDETHTLKKQDLNGDGEIKEDLSTEKKTHGVGKSTLLPANGSTEDTILDPLNSDSQTENTSVETADSTSESSSEISEEDPMEDMSEEDLMKLMEQESENVELKNNTIDDIDSQTVEEYQQAEVVKEAYVNHSAPIKERGTNFFQLADMLRVFVNGELRKPKTFDESQPKEVQEQSIHDFLSTEKNFMFFTGKGHAPSVPPEMQAMFEGLDHIKIEDDEGHIVEIPMSEVKFMTAEEYEEFMNDIREHIGNLRGAPVDKGEKEVEEDKEAKKEETHAHKQQEAVRPEQIKPEGVKHGKETHAFATAEGVERQTSLTLSQINQRRIEEFNKDMSLKMEKIRKKIKQEELNEEHIKRDELKSEIKQDAAMTHESRVEIAQMEAEFKQLQQKLNTQADTTFTVPARKIFRELQVSLDKINTMNPNNRKTVALKKEIVDIARELVKFSSGIKGVSEGSDRIGA